MATLIVSIGLMLVGLYLLAGLIFVFPFLVYGLNRIDETTHKSSVGFRIIISPGIIVLWPILLKKWISAVKMKTSKEDQII